MIRPRKRGQAFSSPGGKSSRMAGPIGACGGTALKSRTWSRPKSRCREVAGDAVHAEAVGAVGGELDLDHRPFEAQGTGRGRPDFRVLRQLDDAVMLQAQPQLARGAEHAVAGDTADRGLLQHVARGRNDGADRGEDALHAGAGVGGTADDLEHALAGLDGTEAETIGIGMLASLTDIGDREWRKRGTRIGDALDLKAQRSERVADALDRGVGLQMLLEPRERELHRESPA